MNMKMKSGFTLVEIMIVVAIIAILAAIAIPNFVKYRKESQLSACLSSQASITTAAESWLSKPANATATSIKDTDIAPADGSGYLKTFPTCPAGGKYTITVDSKTKAVVVKCSLTEHAATK